MLNPKSEWIYKNSSLGLGSLIADDMGLGKTLQVITLLEKFREEGKLKKSPALVVVPTSLVSNWKKESEKFAPKLKTVVFHGVGRKFPKGEFDLMVTTMKYENQFGLPAPKMQKNSRVFMPN